MDIFKPKVVPPLDPGFVSPVLFKRAYREAVKKSSQSEKLLIAVERESGNITRYDVEVLPLTEEKSKTIQFVERTIKFMLWSSGGFKIHLSGNEEICREMKEIYSLTGKRKFDVELMARVYEKDFEVVITDEDSVPAQTNSGKKVGGHLDGCRIGFDLGASDYKLSAVKDGEPIFSTEIPWDPVKQSDPNYHIERIKDGLKLAASKLPKVDAIGGSSAGIIVDSRVMLASLFRSVSSDDFKKKVSPIFFDIQKEWNVPQIVMNDGDVTALAGAMSLNETAILGIAMGSSEATGYLNRDGVISGQLNELAFAPVDYNEDAAVDEWSGDYGVGALYFSQQAVNKLAPAAGIYFPDDMGLPIRLKEVQKLADSGDQNALKIFETIGVYLGYTIVHYLDHYDYKSLLILGRVTSGRGGELIIEKAKEVLGLEFPEIEKKVKLVVPDEKSRRVGQAVAAASLPPL